MTSIKTVMLNSKYDARWRNRTTFCMVQGNPRTLTKNLRHSVFWAWEIRERYIQTGCIHKISRELRLLNLRTLVAGLNARGLLLTPVRFIIYCVPPRPILPSMKSTKSPAHRTMIIHTEPSKISTNTSFSKLAIWCGFAGDQLIRLYTCRQRLTGRVYS